MSKRERAKSAFFSRLFHFLLIPTGLMLEIGFVGVIFYYLKIDIAKNFGWMIGIGVIIWVLILLLRLKYFTEIPQGYTLSAWQDFQKLIGKGSFWDDGFNKKYWISVLGTCLLCVLIGVLAENGDMFKIIPVTLSFSFFAYLYLIAYRNAKKKGKIKDDTKTMLKRLPLVFAPIGIFLIGVLVFLGLGIKNLGLGLAVMVAVIVGGMYVWYRYTKAKYPKSFYNNEVGFEMAKQGVKRQRRRMLLGLVMVGVLVGVAWIVLL